MGPSARLCRLHATAPARACSVEEDGGAGEVNAGEENLGERVVARGDGAEKNA